MVDKQKTTLYITRNNQGKTTKMKLVIRHMFEISIEKCREYRFGVSEGYGG